jgi:hypothetical protein
MEKNSTDKDARYFKVVDAETGNMIPHVVWANDETGEYDQHQLDENGKRRVVKDETGEYDFVFERKIGKIKFVDSRIQEG